MNGKKIFFSEVEAVRVHLFSAFAPAAPASLPEEELALQYRAALSQLIMQELVAQYLEKNKLGLPEEEVDREMERILAGYPAGGFEEVAIEHGISKDLWRGLIRRHLEMETFFSQVLRPGISITPDEVQTYYTNHREDFVIPERWHYLQFASLDRDETLAARDFYLEGRDAAAVQRNFAVSVRDVQMRPDTLPAAVRDILRPLAPGAASEARRLDDQYIVLVLLEKTPEVVLDDAAIYSRVEKVLAEEKLEAAFDAWISRQARRARVRIAAPLVRTAGVSLPEEEPADGEIPG